MILFKLPKFLWKDKLLSSHLTKTMRAHMKNTKHKWISVFKLVLIWVSKNSNGIKLRALINL